MTILLLLLLFPIAIGNLISSALKMTLLEQEVEDKNSLHRVGDHLQRRLICLPLSDAFAPSAVHGMHGKVQHGDKCSLPASIGRLIFGRPYEVPWLFEVTPVKKASREDAQPAPASSLAPMSVQLSKAYVSPLDFRAPENYIFMPQWALRSLGLSPFDEVDVSFVRIKLAALVVLQPLSLEWDALVESGRNPRSVLEHEVNKYSSLTAGAVISIDVDGTTYSFFVKETQAEGGVAVRGVRVQDSDIKVDIDRSYLELLKKRLAAEHGAEEEV